jgi:hypothetical protein
LNARSLRWKTIINIPRATDRPIYLEPTVPTPPSAYTVAREILAADVEMPTEAVLQKARARGVVAPADKVRGAISEVRSALRKKAGIPAPKPAPKAAAKPAPKPAPAAAKTTTAPVPAPAAAPTAPDLTGVFKNVTLVNKVVGLVGGSANAKQVAEAVRACGSVDAFLQHVDLVAGIRPAEPTAS